MCNLRKVTNFATTGYQLHFQVLKQVSTAVQKAIEPRARHDGKQRLMTPRSNPRIYTPIHFMTAAQDFTYQFPDNSSMDLHSRQSGECGVHEPETSRPSWANARHSQVGCKHCIIHVHLSLYLHLMCYSTWVGVLQSYF